VGIDKALLESFNDDLINYDVWVVSVPEGISHSDIERIEIPKDSIVEVNTMVPVIVHYKT